MASVTLSAKDPADVAADALIVAVSAQEDGPALLGSALSPALRRRLTALLEPLGVSGAPDQVIRVPSEGSVSAPMIVLTGVGRPGTPSGTAPAGTRTAVRTRVSNEALRRGAGAAIRALAGMRRVAISFPVPDDAALAATCEGALLAAYDFARYRGDAPASGASKSGGAKPAAGKAPVGSVIVLTESARSGSARAVAQRAQILAEAVHGCRDLVNTAPCDLYPQTFAEAATQLGAQVGATVTVLDEKKLIRGGYGGLIGVGQGSVRPPRLVKIEYAPRGARGHVALVGKGITFDSGGISLKPPANMDQMKSDMSGAAAVLHTVAAAARLKLAVRVTGWLALAENMPSGTAQRPSDVLTMRNKATVEVLNTDAEGRLVLADALVDASAEHPDLIIDVATLTGAQKIALGSRVSAVMSNDDDLRARLHSLADRAGEQIWPLPLLPELRSTMDSAVADIANIGDGQAGTIVGALFLSEFVGAKADGSGPIPWAHLDIATPALNTAQPYGYTPKGGTGVAVRTMLALVEDVAERGA